MFALCVLLLDCHCSWGGVCSVVVQEKKNVFSFMVNF